jgi:Asp-tRNA(Asn)/Glu-tRNA(Gln) amidotransferase A subunit family amidase
MNNDDAQILGLSVADLVASVQSGKANPADILVAYGKKALKAHTELNCLTEVMIASAEVWARECNRKGPLAGMPISLKDTVGVKGWDASIGYSAWVGKPMLQDSALVRLLRDAGAVPFVKTNVPITLLSFESASDVFGRTNNPHKKGYSPGGSTGGEGALLAYGGSRIGIGTDVAGSVRVPAHYSGIYTIRASAQRFVKTGCATSIPGQEGVASVYSPMTRTLDDLETIWKAVVSMKPWDYDHSVNLLLFAY